MKNLVYFDGEGIGGTLLSRLFGILVVAESGEDAGGTCRQDGGVTNLKQISFTSFRMNCFP